MAIKLAADAVKNRNGSKTAANGSTKRPGTASDDGTDLKRWRLRAERGRQTWHYLRTDDEIEAWPQSTADKYFLGLPMNLPTQPPAKRPLAAVSSALSFYSHLQLPPGNWACEYGGPMFLLPGLVITWYVTQTPIPTSVSTQIKRYLFARQNPDDHGWGLHIEGESTVFGTSLNYVVLRILGASEEDIRMIKARATLMKLGGATNGPHWAKFWLSTLGVMSWDSVNPVPPEIWLFPDWVPIAPWRWWIHLRQVFLPMSFIYSKKFSFPPNAFTIQLREELYNKPYESIDFASHRNTICPRDNYHPKTWILCVLNWILVHIWLPILRPNSLKKRAEDWTFSLIQHEDENTEYGCLGPVNGPMNTLACYIHDGPASSSVRQHLDRLQDFMWMKNEGMLMNGTNGVQTWDTSWFIQAVIEAGFAKDPKFKPMLLSALEFLEDQQIRENCREQEKCYRQRRKGAWSFSNKTQGYTVSDTTSEALKAVLMLQSIPGGVYPVLVSPARCRDAVDTILTMQNSSGGFASYEPKRGSEYMELLNAAEVFGRIMVEYDYPECSTAVVTALQMFTTHPEHCDYRHEEIQTAITRALGYIHNAQRPDGSWYGSWGICFTYAGMFALHSLAVTGETYTTSTAARRGCDFLVSKRLPDGGWGESYRGCETCEYVHHPDGSQVVMTCWALIGLMYAGYPEEEVLQAGIKLVMERQQSDGGWKQEGIEGVFNKSVMISYPNYKYTFPVLALGMFAKKYGDRKLL